MKKCFYCKIEKPLNEFSLDRRKYQIKADLGTCKGCKQCYLEQSIRDLSVIYFDFEIDKFVIEKFETKEEVIKFIENNEYRSKTII